MRNITLISTVHEEEGVCNASTLHEILERARPDVIFVEVAPSSFERYLKEKSEWNLETYAVNRYLETHSAAVEPVDLCDAPNDLIAAHGSLHREVRARSPEYSRLKYQDSQHIAQYGFAYLNSQYCIDCWSKLNELIKVTIKTIDIGQEKLLRTYKWWNEVHEQREQEMMKNIKKYSEEHEFNTGIFLLGAAHRSAIIEKSKALSLRNSVALDWNFENYESFGLLIPPHSNTSHARN